MAPSDSGTGAGKLVGPPWGSDDRELLRHALFGAVCRDLRHENANLLGILKGWVTFSKRAAADGGQRLDECINRAEVAIDRVIGLDRALGLGAAGLACGRGPAAVAGVGEAVQAAVDLVSPWFRVLEIEVQVTLQDGGIEAVLPQSDLILGLVGWLRHRLFEGGGAPPDLVTVEGSPRAKAYELRVRLETAGRRRRECDQETLAKFRRRLLGPLEAAYLGDLLAAHGGGLTGGGSEGWRLRLPVR